LNGKSIQVIAHKGASGHAPENTLAAFKKALALGADWIELDVQRVADELFIMHDYRLERTTDGQVRFILKPWPKSANYASPENTRFDIAGGS
jgi:glycerophosphoryl diester phosphodiesterase